VTWQAAATQRRHLAKAARCNSTPGGGGGESKYRKQHQPRGVAAGEESIAETHLKRRTARHEQRDGWRNNWRKRHEKNISEKKAKKT